MVSHTIPLPRISAALVMALTVTLMLLYLMVSLIRQERAVLNVAPAALPITYLRVIEPVPLAPKPRPEPVAVVPEPSIRLRPTTDPVDGGFALEDLGRHELPPLHPTPGALPDGEILPVVKVNPVYPRHAEVRGIEGFVIVEFDVDALGRVRNARVLEASPAGVFDRSALEAVAQFKYKPRVVGGEPTEVTGVLHRITFALESSR